MNFSFFLETFSIEFHSTQFFKHSSVFWTSAPAIKPFNLAYSFSINLYPRDMFSCNNNKISPNLRSRLYPPTKHPKSDNNFSTKSYYRSRGIKNWMNYKQLTRAFHFHSFTPVSITYRFHLITTINKLVGLSHFLSIV